MEITIKEVSECPLHNDDLKCCQAVSSNIYSCPHIDNQSGEYQFPSFCPLSKENIIISKK